MRAWTRQISTYVNFSACVRRNSLFILMRSSHAPNLRWLRRSAPQSRAAATRRRSAGRSRTCLIPKTTEIKKLFGLAFGGATERLSLVLPRADGRLRRLAATNAPHVRPGGKVNGVVAVLQAEGTHARAAPESGVPIGRESTYNESCRSRIDYGWSGTAATSSPQPTGRCGRKRWQPVS